MADEFKSSHPLIIYLTLSLLILTSVSTNLSFHNLEDAIFALQSSNFNLFGNSIAVSDLSVQLLSHTFNSSFNGVGLHGFTFLAPPNSVLFSLDLSTDASTYVHSLRFHVVPRRFSFSDLRNISLSSDPYLETLVPGHVLFVASSGSNFVSINGVRISFPDLYLRPDIAVHGIDGILVSVGDEFLHRLDSIAAPPSFLSPTSAPTSDGFKSVSAPTIGAFSPVVVKFPMISPEIEITPPPISGISPFAQEFKEIPTFSPGISEDRSWIGAFSPDIGAIPASYDGGNTGGSFNSISVPPIDAYWTKNNEIPAPSPSMEFLIPDEYSISPVYEYDDWTHPGVYLSPYNWSPVWSVATPNTVEEWHKDWENMNQKEYHEISHDYGGEYTNVEERGNQYQGQADGNGWKTWETSQSQEFLQVT